MGRTARTLAVFLAVLLGPIGAHAQDRSASPRPATNPLEGNAFAISNGAWWWAVFPGLGVVIVVRAFNMCGRAMERILDPRLKVLAS